MKTKPRKKKQAWQEPFRKEAMRVIDKWRPRLFLHQWTFDVFWMGQDKDDGTFATIYPDHVYFNGRIEVMPRWAHLNKLDREKGLVHEMIHCLVQPVGHLGLELLNGKLVTKDGHRDAIEQLTETFTNVVWKRR